MFYILAKPDIVAEIQSFMQFDGQQWECRECGYGSAMKHVVYNHIDSKHMDNITQLSKLVETIDKVEKADQTSKQNGKVK